LRVFSNARARVCFGIMASATGLYAFPVTGRSLTIRWVFWLTMSILVSSSVCGNQQKVRMFCFLKLNAIKLDNMDNTLSEITGKW